MEATLLVSFVTVNYNGIQDTLELIRSLKAYIAFPYELIVVDNASRQNEAQEISVRYPDVVCLRSERNLGFAGGNNLGMARATGKYLMLINNDTLVKDDSLKYLADFMDRNPQAGGVCPKIRFFWEPYPIQFAGYSPLSSVTLRNHLVGFNQMDLGQYDTPSRSPFLHGAAMMVRREVIRDVGCMPEVYFLYYEELDWCSMISRYGYELWYEPASTVYHKESRSTGQASPLRTYYITRNRLLFAWRNRCGAILWLAIFYQLFVSVPKNVFQFLFQRRFDLAASVLKGVWSFMILRHKLC